MTTQTLRIAIIGAGPAGLTLAAILHRHGIKATIFERDSSAAVRAQGGTLDIHAESGQRAIVAAGLMTEFKKLARPEGDVARIIKKDGTVVLDENEDEQHAPQGSKEQPKEEMEGEERDDDDEEVIPGRPEIDRPDLKDMLLNSLPSGTVRWGKGIKAVSPVEGTKQWTLTFLNSGLNSDSNSANNNISEPDSGPYDLILGADGAWSRVRPVLTDVRPSYAGVSALDVWISPEELAAHPDVAGFIGRGSVFVCAADRFLSMQRHGDGGARAYACVRTSPAEAGGAGVPSDAGLLGLSATTEEGEVDWTDERVRSRFLDRHFGDFAPEITDVVLAMTGQPALRHLHALPVGHRWAPRAGVTLLGDAAHLATPFAGVGVNAGMADAAELAGGIVRYVKDGGAKAGAGAKGEGDADDDDGLARVLGAYEERMFERTSGDAAFTARMLEVEFRDDGCENIARIMSGGAPPVD
ncbi:FAD/NAD(P)-binding domain-containing protein [Hypoxylon rubiginosum]|uniref:FAD/NAD(P)-binding domain-containing protein n=1 Tax=Hypoxylon rubiginosum TaxID=110542 RepID=A0ACB9YZQ7_9PEZI|nr:FAD/NAD(P)-binding domain-containing protein [Hypoxylon rubiginosum]